MLLQRLHGKITCCCNIIVTMLCLPSEKSPNK